MHKREIVGGQSSGMVRNDYNLVYLQVTTENNIINTKTEHALKQRNFQKNPYVR